MGFYGNITNTARTQFQFDRIYPNRDTMELRKFSDGVYAGRYILIEYETSLDIYKSVYRINGKFYTSENAEKTTLIVIGDGSNGIKSGEIVRVEPGHGAEGKFTELWKGVGEEKQEPIWSKVSEMESKYQANYQIDQKWAEDNNVNSGRGWDSTVWQKVYVEGHEKYVMIAELNTVVPTFDVSADAPSMFPVTPHFDTNSSNVYYKLHWQPQWGVRLKSANQLAGPQLDDAGNIIEKTTVDYSTDEKIYPTDESTTWKKYEYDASSNTTTPYYYDEKNNTWEKEQIDNGVAAAVYFNKKGFDESEITIFKEHYNKDHQINEQTTINGDFIQLAPTGQSGHRYNKHNGVDLDLEPKEDIQELAIILPSIGDTIAKVWNIVYGDEDLNGGRTRNLNIDWDSTGGHRLVDRKENGNDFTYTYNPDKVKTLAGCINSVHDLMGMIIINQNPHQDPEKDKYVSKDIYDSNKIYYYNEKYYRAHKTYTYVNIEKNDFDKSNGEYYYNKSNGDFPQYGLWNNEVGYVDGLATRVEVYEMQELKGFASDFNTIHGLLLEIRKILETGDMLTRDQSTVQGSINALNDIIAKFARMTPTNVMIVDELGRVHGAPQTTKQTFTYKNEGLNNGSQNISDSAASEDRWIYWDVDDDYENPLITLKHNFTKVEDTTTTANKNTDGANDDGNNKAYGDTIELYTPIVDGMGHVVGKNIETVTLPYGYKTFNTTGLNEADDKDIYTKITKDENGANTSKAEAKESKTIANNTQDTMSIDPGNKWIQIEFEDDKLTIAHEIHAVNEVLKSSNLNTDNVESELNSDKITIQDIEFDNAGHVIKNQPHTYTLPYSFKTITTNGSNSLSVSDMSIVTENIVADNTQDTLAINSHNKWIKIANNANADSITFAHEVNPIDTTSNGTTNSNTESTAVNENNINIPDWTYDEAGHITSKHDHKYTLPFGFKTIKSSNTEDNEVSAPSTTIKAAGQIADNTQDTLNINASNRWIKIDNNTEDTIKLGHRLSNFESGSANTKYGLAADTTVANLDADNIFEVPCFRFDEAGHIDFAETHTVTIPENFNKVAITLSDINNTDKLVGTAGIIEADTLTDTLTLTEGNRWINIDADTTNDKVTFSHYVQHFDEDATGKLDYNSSENKTFEIQNIGWDNAGHIISSKKTTYILPNNFKTVTITNEGANTTDKSISTNGNLTAKTLIDTATFNTGNRWIALDASVNDNKVTIYHTFAGDTSSSANLSDNQKSLTPNFGDPIKVLTVGIDQAGHVKDLKDYEITLPKPSLNNLTTTKSSVLTNISMVAESGAITQTNVDVGTLTLEGYNQGTDQGDLVDSDSINSAFAKLQNQIHAEVTDRDSAISTAIGNVTGESTETIASLSEKLETLQSQYDDLLARIKVLEAKHPTEEEPTV